jgi:hypothetical protein
MDSVFVNLFLQKCNYAEINKTTTSFSHPLIGEGAGCRSRNDGHYPAVKGRGH